MPRTKPSTPDFKSTTPAVIRAARVLDLLARANEGLSLKVLFEQTQIPKSSLHGLCETLIQLQMLRQDSSGNYMIGPHVVLWARAFQTQTNLVKEFFAEWSRTGPFPDDTVTLSVLDQTDVVYIACQNGSKPLQVSFQNGMRLPAHFSATGKAMFSTLPDHRLKHLLENSPWPVALTSKSVKTPKALLSELKLCRERGYSVDQAQIREGMTCIGAPIFDAASTDQAVAGVAVSFLASELSEAQIDIHGQRMRAFAQRVSRQLGYDAAN